MLSKDLSLKVCKAKPVKVHENASLVIDVSKRHWEDVKDDSNGVYDRILRCATWTMEVFETEEGISSNVLHKKKVKLSSRNQYHLTIRSKCNKACPKLVRSIFLLKDQESVTQNQLCFLQYHISTGEKTVNFHVPAHGNSNKKKCTPFYPTQKSTLDDMKNRLYEDKSAARIYSEIVSEVGGVENATT